MKRNQWMWLLAIGAVVLFFYLQKKNAAPPVATGAPAAKAKPSALATD